MTQLIESLINGNNQTESTNLLSASSNNTSLSETLRPLINDPASDFVVSMMEIADNKGILDASFQEETVEDQADVVENADPMQFLSREELTVLVKKYMAIPEPLRSQIGDALRQELPPQVAQRLDAVVRFVEGKEGQQQVTM